MQNIEYIENMQTLSAQKLRTDLTPILNNILSNGTTYLITRNGHPVATIGPATNYNPHTTPTPTATHDITQ